MNRTAPAPVAVVVAAIDARDTIVTSLARFLDEAGDRAEVVLVDASRDGTADEAERRFPRLRVLRREPGRLAPQLWLDGLLATAAPFVALSTGQMAPRPGWLPALLDRLDTTGAAAVGGPIEPAPGLAPNDRAVYLVRYVNYLRPLAGRGLVEPPGDNVLYRRARLPALESLGDGFWEAEIHARLRQRGERLEMDDRAVVEFQGRTRLPLTLQQRRAHARRYAAGRARRMGWGQRLARSAAAPAVPFVLLQRILAALSAQGRPIGPWLPALPRLAMLLAAWAAGEACGTILGPGGLAVRTDRSARPIRIGPPSGPGA
jgi:hypothetical protein